MGKKEHKEGWKVKQGKRGVMKLLTKDKRQLVVQIKLKSFKKQALGIWALISFCPGGLFQALRRWRGMRALFFHAQSWLGAGTCRLPGSAAVAPANPAS